ncbi:hypothetical protein GCM10018962_91470 [Dactylosporangium matsuzakiense]|uniref:Uncharacterized protein n=1 Tax=Dactylosporangium matsuzakiense TaxID=53360 RepID=A0A9W6KR08_9ACTN|nr:hypothetical protein GCM10017581_083210 [Dactylosporangium matsuzakiense]
MSGEISISARFHELLRIPAWQVRFMQVPQVRSLQPSTPATPLTEPTAADRSRRIMRRPTPDVRPADRRVDSPRVHGRLRAVRLRAVRLRAVRLRAVRVRAVRV